MDKDARKQSLLELHTRRKQVVRLRRKGMGVMQIVQMWGLRWLAVRAALTLFEQGGWNALKPRARGKEVGNGRAMTPGQEQAIRDIICDKRPEQRKLDFALWNRGAVAILIECAWSLLCAARPDTCGLCGGRRAAEAVDDFQRYQSGQSTPDDY